MPKVELTQEEIITLKNIEEGEELTLRYTFYDV